MSMVAHLGCYDAPKDPAIKGVVVWAFDHVKDDVRGICNLMRLPCPRCGIYGRGYDGHSSQDWEAMHRIAEEHGWHWDPHPYNHWEKPE